MLNFTQFLVCLLLFCFCFVFYICCPNFTFESYLLLKGQDLEQVFKVLPVLQEDRAYLVQLVPQELRALQSQDIELKTSRHTYKVSSSFYLLLMKNINM